MAAGTALRTRPQAGQVRRQRLRVLDVLMGICGDLGRLHRQPDVRQACAELMRELQAWRSREQERARGRR